MKLFPVCEVRDKGVLCAMYCARNGAMAAIRTKKPPPPLPPPPPLWLCPLARASTQYLSLGAAAVGKTVMQKVAHEPRAILRLRVLCLPLPSPPLPYFNPLQRGAA